MHAKVMNTNAEYQICNYFVRTYIQCTTSILKHFICGYVVIRKLNAPKIEFTMALFSIQENGVTNCTNGGTVDGDEAH